MRTRAFTLTAIGVALLLFPGATELRAQDSGVQLWGRTCARCHNARPVNERTDREWATIVNHMRARGNLTRSEARAILEFLQAANPPEAGAVSAAPADGRAPAAGAARPGAGAPEAMPDLERLQALLAYVQKLALMEARLP